MPTNFKLEKREKIIEGVATGIPFGCMSEANDEAFTALYLGSDESKYIAGTQLTIDGGILAGSNSAPKKHED